MGVWSYWLRGQWGEAWVSGGRGGVSAMSGVLHYVPSTREGVPGASIYSTLQMLPGSLVG